MLNSNHAAEVAQLVEQPIRNRQVDGSSPPLGSNLFEINSASVDGGFLPQRRGNALGDVFPLQPKGLNQET